MAWDAPFGSFAVAAPTDLSAKQYFAVSYLGAIAGRAGTMIGTVYNKPTSGEHATIKLGGIIKWIAGAAVAAGAYVAPNSTGYAVTVTAPASNEFINALCMVAVASGEIGTFWHLGFAFPNSLQTL